MAPVRASPKQKSSSLDHEIHDAEHDDREATPDQDLVAATYCVAFGCYDFDCHNSPLICAL
jgi:hypothetical protein